MNMRVTQTQKLIAEAALYAIGAEDMFREPAIVDTLVRAMLVIEDGRMQAYMLRGFKWSCISRGRLQPREVAQDTEALAISVDDFHQFIDQARGEAARRIRGNRARRIRDMVREAENIRDMAEWRMKELQLRRRGIFDPEAANWDEEPRHLPMGRPDEHAA